MKMITVLILSLSLGVLSSCAHTHKCSCDNAAVDKSKSACTNCKDTEATKSGCTCSK